LSAASAWRGVADYKPAGNIYQTERIQIPPYMRADRVNQVFGAITDQDLQALPVRPLQGNGQPMDAATLRRMVPDHGPGGFRFRLPSMVDGRAVGVLGSDGKPFVLDIDALAPTLRGRVPDGFR
jgi:hypothetical protein